MQADIILIPIEYALHPSHPNPFNQIANISYSLPVESKVLLEVFNINGRLIDTLVDEYKTAGYYQLSWEAFNISSGIYFIKVESGQNVSTQKLMLMK